MSSINLSIIDDDRLFAVLLKDFLQKEPGMEVNGIYHDGQHFIEHLQRNQPLPHIILLDLRMQKLNGIDTISVLKRDFPKIKIIVLSSYYKSSFMGFMIKSGVNAFAPKEIAPESLIQMIKDVNEKGHSFTKIQMEVIREQLSNRTPKPHFESKTFLTERETEILELICQQMTAKEIGGKLFITSRTVEGHKNNLLLKTGAKNIAGLVIYAVQNNIIKAEGLFLA